jgi:myosin protein heavy chain
MALKSERDALEAKYQKFLTKEGDRDARISQLDEKLLQMRSHLTDLSTERDELSQAKTNLQQQVEKNESAVQELQDKLAQAAAAVSTNTRQLQTTQNDLRSALRRADDAERTQKNLQTEGTELMRSLEEMRPKIVELTGAKLDLAEKVESLEHSLRSRDSVIAQLESDLEESLDKYEQSEQVWKGKLASQEKRQMDAQGSSADLQKAYTEVQEELDSALVSLRSLEAQRTNQHQEASRRLEEIARLSSLSHTQGQELDALRQELEARQKAHVRHRSFYSFTIVLTKSTQDEEQAFIDQAQDEIEVLRAELNSRDNEIEHLRNSINSSTDAPHSLDAELLSSLRQQHALDLSAASAQVRALEDTIYDKERTNHALQKQINTLEDQLAQLRSNYPGQRAFSPIPSRPSSRALESDSRRISLGSHRSRPPPLSRSVFDHAMSPETLHKRKVSLSMLKARIDSEVKTAPSQPPSRALSPVHSDTHSHPSSLVTPHLHRPQFLDETHVFWCHSCHGDLVIL